MSKRFLEINERGYTGPEMAKSDWDMDAIVMNVAELVEEYDLCWQSDVIVPDDGALADRLFAAARELLLRTGVYNVSTGRVIKLSAREIDDGLRYAPKSIVMGEGKQARDLYARKIEDTREPLIWAGNPGCPIPERFFLENVISWMQEPVVDLITCGSLVEVDGFTVRSGDVTELMAVRRELQLLHLAQKRTGRVGIGMLAAESSVTEIGDLAATHPAYLRPCDSHLVAMFNELMIDRGNLVRAANSIEYGMRNASLACTLVGGLAGDAPGAAMTMIASMMAANLVCLADYHLCHPIHINQIATTARGCLWLESMVCQAFARNAPAIIVCDVYPKSGGMTRELMYEVAANALVASVSGGHIEGAGAADGNLPNGTGLEVRLMGEVGKAVTKARMTRTDVNRLVLELISRYEHVFGAPGGNPGLSFDQCYDLQTIKPKPEWEAIYEEVKDELADLGMRF